MLLFYLYEKKEMVHLKIGGENVRTTKYADNIVILAGCEDSKGRAML